MNIRKFNIILRTVAVLFIGVPSWAGQFKEISIFWPEINQEIGVVVDLKTGDYKYESEKFYNPKLAVGEIREESLQCEKVMDLIRTGELNPPTSSFRLSQDALVGFQLFKLPNRELIEDRIRQAVGQERLPTLNNVGFLIPSKIFLKLSWDEASLTNLSFPKVLADAEDSFVKSVNDYDVRQSLRETGVAKIKLNNRALLCDLKHKKISIKISVEAGASSELQKESPIQAQHIVNASRELSHQQSILNKLSWNSVYLSEKEDAMVTAAGLLAFQLHSMGFNAHTVMPDHFIKIFKNIFPYEYKKVAVIPQAQAERIVIGLRDAADEMKHLTFPEQKLILER